MEVYVIKRDDGKYHYLTPEHKTEWIDNLYYADRISALDESDYNSIKKWADKRFPNCKLVQITVLEGNLSDYTKQVRKEVVDFIDKCFEMQKYESIWINPDKTEFSCDVSYAYEWWESFRKILLDQIQGETK